MQILIVWMILLSLWVCTAPLAHTDTIKPAEDVQATDVTGTETTPSASGGLFQESLSTIVREAGIENPIVSVKKTADAAARSVGRSLGQYLRGQYQQMKNEDILQRFDAALMMHLSGLQLSPEERRRMIQKIQDDYVQDAESGRLELDQQNFRDLPKIVKKEYAEIELSRTGNGNVPTYDLKGNLKTQWTVNNGVLNGPAVSYYPDGEIKFIDMYKNGRKVNRKKFDPEGKLEFEQNYDYDLSAPAIPQVPAAQAAQAPVPAPANPVIPPMPEPALDPDAPQASDNGRIEVKFREVKTTVSNE